MERCKAMEPPSCCGLAASRRVPRIKTGHSPPPPFHILPRKRNESMNICNHLNILHMSPTGYLMVCFGAHESVGWALAGEGGGVCRGRGLSLSPSVTQPPEGR